jgi:TonB family protein
VLRSIPLLDAAALDAVRQWEFTPTRLNGVAVPVIMTVTVSFALAGDGGSSAAPTGAVGAVLSGLSIAPPPTGTGDPATARLQVEITRFGEGWRVENRTSREWRPCSASLGKSIAPVTLYQNGAAIINRADFKPPLDGLLSAAPIVTCVLGGVSYQSNSGPSSAPGPEAGGALGAALRNLQQYVQTRDNGSGNVQVAKTANASIQFDTRGVDFTPWLRRFVAQMKGSWLVPPAAMTAHDHVVVKFNVHKDGTITDVEVVRPSAIASLNESASNAIAATNPAESLPVEYPPHKALFTVTFYYNEDPPKP